VKISKLLRRIVNMKFRKDFVTNSSSSSYVCEICGRSESGWDMGLSEAEMVECENGHVICQDEMLEMDKKEIVKLILENEYNSCSEEELQDMNEEELLSVCDGEFRYNVPECLCPVCNFIEYSENDLSQYLQKKYGTSRDEVFAEVKQINKRRKKLYENEYITYVCKQFNLNPTEIVAQWKEEFGTYSKFRDFLRK
jgi:AraC-like DNA-binding protein